MLSGAEDIGRNSFSSFKNTHTGERVLCVWLSMLLYISYPSSFSFQLIGIRKLDNENEIQIIRIWLTINLLIRPLHITQQGIIHTQLLTINARSSINQTIDIRFDTFALISPLGVLSIKSTVVERSIKKYWTLVKIRLIKGGFQVVNAEGFTGSSCL